MPRRRNCTCDLRHSEIMAPGAPGKPLGEARLLDHFVGADCRWRAIPPAPPRSSTALSDPQWALQSDPQCGTLELVELRVLKLNPLQSLDRRRLPKHLARIAERLEALDLPGGRPPLKPAADAVPGAKQARPSTVTAARPMIDVQSMGLSFCSDFQPHLCRPMRMGGRVPCVTGPPPEIFAPSSLLSRVLSPRGRRRLIDGMIGR